MNRASARPFVTLALLLGACSHQQSGVARESRSRPSGIVITAEDIQRSPGMSLEQLLLARVPGLTVARAADGHAILHLRGETTIMGDEEPLIVVNGLPLGPSASGNLSAINPQDIESIQVLRDAATTSIYGIRGANGVILIRTKQS
jgi:TonB-dependent SusC/RagA subfamily outer membrane receptor